MDGETVLVIIVIIIIIVLIYYAFVYWYVSFPLAAIGTWIYFEQKKRKAQAEREKAETARRMAEEAKRQKEIQHHKEQQQKCHQQMVHLGEEAIVVFESTPSLLANAEEHLDQAQLDFAEGVFAPFWDSIEKATWALGRFDEGVSTINRNSSQYTTLLREYEAEPPKFPLSPRSVAKLLVGTSTAERMKAIVRNAQRNFQFATIYEQRKTNQILVAGFTNLAQALDQMALRITSSLDNLTRSVDVMSSTLNDSMLAIHSKISEIAETTSQLLEDASSQAAARESREDKVIEMLDNIQRKRKPFP